MRKKCLLAIGGVAFVFLLVVFVGKNRSSNLGKPLALVVAEKGTPDFLADRLEIDRRNGRLLRMVILPQDPRTVTNWNLITDTYLVWAESKYGKDSARFFYDDMKNDKSFDGFGWYSSRSWFNGETIMYATTDSMGNVSDQESFRVDNFSFRLINFSAPNSTNGLGTPSALLEELRVSVIKNDEALFLKCFVESESLQQCLQEAFRQAQATLRFREAVVSIYGEKGWEEFQQLGEELGARPRFTPNAVPTDETWWSKLEIQTEGEQGVFFNPITQMTNSIQKSSSGWKINAHSAFDQDIEPIKLANFLKSTTDAIKEITSEIRTNRISISDLGFELFQKGTAKRSSP